MDRPCSNTNCDELVDEERIRITGYDTCLTCGEAEAEQRRHTVVPMHKSNYIHLFDLLDLRGINNKGGFFR
tara:strand:+ start:2998 stop:3210 length:213 start_codon:yes stop_codon:yes gene_type:complete